MRTTVALLLGLILLFSVLLTFVNCGEYFPITRTPVGLEQWARVQVTLADKIKRISPWELEGKPYANVTKSYLREHEDSVRNLRDFSGSVSQRAEAITSNPVATLRMIRQLAHDFLEIKPILLLFKDAFQGVLASQFLTYKDVNDAMLGLLRISHVYGYAAESVAAGKFGGIETGARLTALHCYEIGLHAYANNFYSLAIEWLELAGRMSMEDLSLTKALVKPALDEIIEKHDEAVQNPPLLRFPHVFDKKLGPVRNEPQLMETRRKQRDVLLEQHGGDPDVDYNDINYWALCSSGSFQTDKEVAELFCWYDNSRHPYWLINPLKLEMLSKNPDVLQIYDIIHDQKIQRLQELVTKSLSQSPVVDNDTPGATGSLISKVRTSVNGWIYEAKYPELHSVVRTIEKVTGLNAFADTTSDFLQVAAYTFSGHYEVHIDAIITDSVYGPAKGDRIATFMFYLHEPELGGHTAFTQAGTTARPIKGSAVFWYDLYSDEAADYNTYHGACPVVLGKKWVANKWIRYKDQFLNRKCGLKPGMRYAMPQAVQTSRTTVR